MTAFIRSIFQSAPGSPLASPATTAVPVATPSTASASASAATATSASAALATSSSATTTMAIKTELLAESAAPMEIDPVKVEMVDSALGAPLETSKAQRAARRDVVNARRDKRKAGTGSDVVMTPASPASSCDDHMDIADDDKSKKMKTGRTSSFAVAGGLGASVASPSVTSSKRASTSTSATASASSTSALLFTPEIDAAGEERIRAMEAQLETLDPDSKEAKKKRRLIRNRMSAQLHRERKKAYVGQLEEQLLEKDRELKLLQEKLSRMMDESEKLKKQMVDTEVVVAASPAPSSAMSVDADAEVEVDIDAPETPEPMPSSLADGLQVKEEPPSWDSPWPLTNADQWDFSLDDTDMVDFETDDLLRNIDNPFAALDMNANDIPKPMVQHGELHAAKKNIAMMMAVMFSVGFFGNTSSVCDLSSGSAFSTMFEANSAQEFSQMSIASRIVACLEKTSWKDFRDVSSWLSAQRKTTEAVVDDDESDDEEEEIEAAPVGIASVTMASPAPSAHSDVTDDAGSCSGTPAPLLHEETLESDFPPSLMEDFVDDAPFAMEEPLTEPTWLLDSVPEEAVIEPKEVAPPKPAAPKKSSLTTRLYSKLSALWREKNQVLLTVYNDKREVLQRSVADMSTIREGLQTGDLFTPVRSGEELSTTIGEDHSISFLYPLSAIGSDEKKALDASALGSASGSADPVFLEVSCQRNGAALPLMQM